MQWVGMPIILFNLRATPCLCRLKPGVEIPSIEAHLDRRALKLKRRPGNSKAYRIKAAAEVLEKKNNGDA